MPIAIKEKAFQDLNKFELYFIYQMMETPKVNMPL